MKTFGRILIILAAFVLVMGIIYVAVDANSSSTSPRTFERGSEGPPQLTNSERPDFGGAGPAGGGWTVGLVKNIGSIAVLVALIVVPKSLRSMRRKAVGIRVE